MYILSLGVYAQYFKDSHDIFFFSDDSLLLIIDLTVIKFSVYIV